MGTGLKRREFGLSTPWNRRGTLGTRLRQFGLMVERSLFCANQRTGYHPD
jgi:hypothetical protein